MTPGWLLAGAAVGWVAGLVGGVRHPRFWVGVSVAGAVQALGAAGWVLADGTVWDWRAGMVLGGEAVHLRLDGLSAFFLALLALLGGVGAVYAQGYWTDREHPVSAPSGRLWWNALVLHMGLVLVAANGLHFLIAWELFTLSAYFLITRERHRRDVRRAGWLYLVASHAGTVCLFALFAGLAARTGGWELGPMSDRADLAPLFWLALFGFGLKAGLFPLHVWLPSAHANAPSHVSAMLSGMALKMGIYGLVRFGGWLPVPAAAGWVVAGLGVVSAVLGVAFALGQHDLKRLLAYHSVENIGIILIGYGFALIAAGQGPDQARWGRLALGGALLHVWNHGLFKALLFLGAGAVVHATGTRRMSRLGGLWRNMPWTAALFGLGATAIAGLPPLNGLVSEWMVYLGLFEIVLGRGPAAWAAIPAAVLLAITGALALACFVKVCGVVFLGEPRSPEAAGAHEGGPLERGPMLVLAGACVAIGLAPLLIWPAVDAASAAWHPAWADLPVPAPLGALGDFHRALVVVAGLGVWALFRRVARNGVTRAGTWDCGYAAPTARMQYTAGSFAGIITEWFAWILRPERRSVAPEGVLPGGARDEEHTPETVLEQVVEPVGTAVMRVSTAVRRLQHGRLQAYILYLAVGGVVLALLAVLGGSE